MSEYSVSLEDALARVVVKPDYDPGSGPGECVHTFRPSVMGLIGAHWYLADLREAMERYGVEDAGELATERGHCLVLIDDDGPLFIEAYERPS